MDLQYVETTINVERFHLLADGGRPVLKVFVAVDDDTIWIAPIDDTFVSSGEQKTKGVAHRHPVGVEHYMDPDADNPDLERFAAQMFMAANLSPTGVCMASVAEYVLPRAVTFMARAYVAKK